MKKSEALDILGLQDGATDEEINKAHRAKAIANHPDRFTDPTKKAAAEEKMKQINEARDVLIHHSWDPEYGPAAGGDPFTGTYRPYSGYGGSGYGGGQQTGGGYGYDPFNPFGGVWVDWDNTQSNSGGSQRGQQNPYANPFGGVGSGFNPYDPFASIFTQRPRKTAKQELEEAKKQLNLTMGLLTTKLIVLAICMLLGAPAIGMIVYAATSLFYMIWRQVSSCSGMIALPFVIMVGTPILFWLPPSSFTGTITPALIIFFVLAIIYDIAISSSDLKRYNTVKEKAKFEE